MARSLTYWRDQIVSLLPSYQVQELWREIQYKHSWSLDREWSSEIKYTNKQVGVIGEDLACEYLRQCGYKVLTRNFESYTGNEIDIVARRGEVLVFVEVKCRVSPDRWQPISAINTAKRRRLSRAAHHYLEMLSEEVPYRYDGVEVILRPGELPQLNIIEALEMGR